MTIPSIDLNTMTARITASIDPERIIPFGSQARDEAHAESDVDLLIITREEYGPHNSRRRAMAKVWRLLADIPVSKDDRVVQHQRGATVA